MIKKYSITLQNHKTSISLEDEFIIELKKISDLENQSLSNLISSIDKTRTMGDNFYNLSSAIRVFVLNYVKTHK